MPPPPKQRGFVRTYALPAVWLFALPALALWFAGHAGERFDAQFLAAVAPQIEGDASLSTEQKAEAEAFYAHFPPSVACVDTRPELDDYRENLADTCSDLRQFGWIRGMSLASLGIGLGALLFIVGCALASFVSRPLQYLSFLVGWHVLRVVGAVQTVLQGTLAVFLSFWITALWMQRYSPKLIGIVGVIAALAAYKVVRAIFAKPAAGVDVEGELVTQADAPELWAQIHALCSRLQTNAPDQLVAGIDDNFFVTEGEVRIGSQTLQGRTLYVSLALLRIMSRNEADAVLAHEMAHLRGGDTAHSKRMSPMLARFGLYLDALHGGVITRPIFHFMLAYYGLFSLSLGKSRREHEFAADALAASLTSPSDIASSLLKVGAYASYRERVEEALFEKNEQHAEVGIAARVAAGFASYAGTEALHFDLHEAVTPHPFDSHPPLSARLQKLGSTLDKTQYGSVLLARAASSWVDAIATSSDIEQRLWAAYESRFAAAHELALAYRYEPANDVERAHVEKFFPALSFEGKPGEPAVQLDFEKVVCAAWEQPLPLAQIASASVDTRLMRKYLDLKLVGGLFKGKRSICLSKLSDGDALVAAFERYYGRHRAMAEQRLQRAS